MNEETYEKIISKKEFSQLLKKDVALAYSKFEKRQVSDTEKIRLIRDLLHKVFSSFTSQKLLSPKNKDPEWILRKHLSTKERLPYYRELYDKLNLKGNVIDLGAGVNGFSYKFFNNEINYVAIEAIGQLVDLMNDYFRKERIRGGAMHLSLFDTEKLKEIISKIKKPKTVFLFKTLDSLEMLEDDYSKKLLKEITPLVDKVVISFATRSMVSRKKFKAKRNWIINFITENFKLGNDFELGGERYIVFNK